MSDSVAAGDVGARRWLCLLACAPLLCGLANDIQELDPTQYAEAGRHIAESGDWLRPRDDSGPYDDKPPMCFWLIALSIKLLGATSLAVRMPSLIAALLAVLATALIGRELWGERVGLLAAALLAVSPALQLMVADPKIDAVLTAYMSWSVAFFLLARRRPALIWAAWLCIAGGLLTKGPIAVIAPLFAVLPEALRPGWRSGAPQSLRAPESLRARLFALQPLLGPLLVVLLCLPYALAHPLKLVYFHLWEQSFGRLTGQSVWHNSTGPFFFLHTALWAFLPFAPALVYALAIRLTAALRARALPADPARLPLFWLLVPLLGISASAYKLPQYLYWLAPPAALLAARALDQLEAAGNSSGGQRGAARALVAVQLLLSAAAPALVLVALLFWFPPGSRAALFGWPALTAALVLGGLFALRRAPIATGLAASGIAVLSACQLFFHGYLHPAILAYQPDHAFGERARREDPTGSVLPFLGAEATNAAGFYARRDALQLSPADLSRAVQRGQARVAIVEPSELSSLAAVGLRAEPLLTLPSYPTSKPSAAFLRQSTRASEVRLLLLVSLSALPASPKPR